MQNKKRGRRRMHFDLRRCPKSDALFWLIGHTRGSTNERRSPLSCLRTLFVGEVLKCCLLGKMTVGAYLHALLELGNDFGKILEAASPVDSAGS